MASSKGPIIVGAVFAAASVLSAATALYLKYTLKKKSKGASAEPKLSLKEITTILTHTSTNTQSCFKRSAMLFQQLSATNMPPDQVKQGVEETFERMLSERDAAMMKEHNTTPEEVLHATEFYSKTDKKVKQLTAEITRILGSVFGLQQQVPEEWTAGKFAALLEGLIMAETNLLKKLIVQARKEHPNDESLVKATVSARLKAVAAKSRDDYLARNDVTQDLFTQLAQHYSEDPMVNRRVMAVQQAQADEARKLGFAV